MAGGRRCFLTLHLPGHVDTPNIVVPPEVMAGTEVEVSCMVPDNCPELHPELSWLGHEGLGEPTVLGRLRRLERREKGPEQRGCRAFLDVILTKSRWR